MTRPTAAEVAVVSQAEVNYNIIILMDNIIENSKWKHERGERE